MQKRHIEDDKDHLKIYNKQHPANKHYFIAKLSF